MASYLYKAIGEMESGSTTEYNIEITPNKAKSETESYIPKYAKLTNVEVILEWKTNIPYALGQATYKLYINGEKVGSDCKAWDSYFTNTHSNLQDHFYSEHEYPGVPKGNIKANLTGSYRKFTVKHLDIKYTYENPKFVISLSQQGEGTVSGEGTYDVGTNATITATPAKGYKFLKWLEDGDTNATRTVTVANGSQTQYSTPLNRTAVFEKVPCTITYDGNGATYGTVNAQEGFVGESLKLPICNTSEPSVKTEFYKYWVVVLYYNEGDLDADHLLVSRADFLGWYTAAEDGERVGGGGDSYTPTGSITLYAHWSEMPAVTLETITRKGYTFLGWYTAAEGGTKVGDGGDSYTPTENAVHLYVQWSSNAINQFRIGSKSPEFYLGQIPVLKIFKGTQEIYYNPFVKDTLVSLPYGSKIKFGSYPTTEEKLVWFIVDKGHTGYPLGSVTLMAKQPVAALCFDNDEPNNDNVKAQRGGNPRYSLSNISQWLNAQEPQGWFVKQHEADAEPDYASQAGFLSCFHPQEISSILNTTLNIPVPDFETGNFLTCDVVETKVFIPSSTEVGYPSYGDKFNGKTTSSIFRHLPYDDIPSNYCWTRTARGQSSNLFLYSQRSNDAQSADTSHGIQPIINLPGFLDVSENPDSDGCYTVIF